MLGFCERHTFDPHLTIFDQMKTRTSLSLAALSSLFALTACGNGSSEDANAQQINNVSTTDTRPTSTEAGGIGSFEVTLAGPPYQGTHSESGELNCIVHNGLWQAGWESPEATGISGVMLQLKDVPSSGGSTDKLSFSVVFGSQADPDASMAIIDVTGAEHGRDGRGSITREGEGAVIRVEGTAQHGVPVTAVVRCAAVDELE